MGGSSISRPWTISRSSDSRRAQSTVRGSSKRSLTNKTLRLEMLEQRTLLSGDGVFTRTFGTTSATGSVAVYPVATPPHSAFSDSGNSPNMTFAGGTAYNSRTYFDATADGAITISAVHPTAVGNATTFPQASVSTFLGGSVDASTSYPAELRITGVTVHALG